MKKNYLFVKCNVYGLVIKIDEDSMILFVKEIN